MGGKTGAISGSNIGHKMLAMMGWSGGGLGQHGSGRSEPITAEYVFGRYVPVLFKLCEESVNF